jgi:WD40 repeat protein/serine/threonine protein kinase/DNA-binding XRE family transcriptional regulator
MPFGRFVRTRRRALDLTQEELARQVGCAAITLRKIEAGDMRPSQQVAARLAAALDVSVEEREDFIRAAREIRAEPREQRTAEPGRNVTNALDLSLSESLNSNYRIEEQIGVGSFGVVYRAQQPRLDRLVAVKVIRPQYADHPDFVRRFEAEAQIVARLEHPHIVPLYDYWREPGVAYLVMRYMRGGSLLTLLQQGPPPLPVTLRILTHLGAALQTAHRVGVIHRDLKPANVLLDDDVNAYLADFGIAKDLHRPEAALSLVGAFIGSPAYSSPEQIRAEPVTQQTDIYALGLLLYELLAGVRPFQGPTTGDLIQQHLSAVVPPLATHRTDLPAALDRVIQQATAKSPVERHGEVAALVADVQAILDSNAPVITSRVAPHAVAASPTLILDLAEQDNPYKGLRPFGESDAATFFGREAFVQQLLSRMAEDTELASFLAVVGPSGSGKSSAVQAGVLPALRQGALPGSSQWYIVVLVPGAEPLTELASALLRVAPAGVTDAELQELVRSDSRGLIRAARAVLPADQAVEMLLVIDQFEELFTLCSDVTVRAHFLENIITAVLDEGSRVRVVITLRADFVDRPLQYVDFGELFRQRSEFVLPMTPEELERAIVGPAHMAGLALEEGLAAQIVSEHILHPGALPLLQHALSELYARRQGRVLTRAAYTAIGGVGGALTASAEALYNQLDFAGQDIARRILLSLVAPGEGAEDTRRRVHRADLHAAGAQPVVEQILDRFSQARLLTFDRDPLSRAPTVEVAHEALFRVWPRLRAWIDTSREQLQTQRRLHAAAMEWMESGHDDSFLASGARLAQFEALAASDALWLTADEQSYLNAGLRERDHQEQRERERRERELRQARRSLVRLRWLAGALIGFLLAALALAMFAYQQQQDAQRSARVAQGQALASAAQAAIAEGNFDQARPLSLAAAQAPGAAPEAQAILSQAAYAPGTRRLFSGHTDAVMSVALSADGQWALSGSSDNTLRLWDVRHGSERRRLLGLTSNVWSVALSPDGRFALAASPDMLIYVWDTTSDAPLRRLAGHTDEVTSVSVSPDGAWILSGSRDTTLRLWNLASGREIRRFSGHTDWVWGTAFSPDGRLALSGSSDNTMRLWDTGSGQEVRRFEGHSNRVQSVAFSPDGRFVASGSWDETARLWDAATGAEMRAFTPHEGTVAGVVFSPDGRLLASASGNDVHIWDVASGRELQRFKEHRDEVFDLTFSPDARFILSGSRDGTLRLWDLQHGAEIRRLIGHESWIRSVAISRDGRFALSGAWDWTLRFWDLETGQILRQMDGHTDGVEAVALSRDGARALSGSADGTLRLWDLGSGQELQRFVGHESYVWDVAFSPDDARALSGSADGTLRLWDLASGQELQRFVGHIGGVESVAFSPDGSKALSGGVDGVARVWDLATGATLQQFKGHTGTISSVAYSPDGQFALSGSADGTARLWDLASGRDLGRFPNQSGPALCVAFSPDGRRALFTSGLSTLAIWDVATGQELRRFDTGGALTYSATFSPDGKSVLAGTTDTTLRLWRVDELPQLLAYVQEQRYLPALSCAQRERYQLPPLCASQTTGGT